MPSERRGEMPGGEKDDRLLDLLLSALDLEAEKREAFLEERCGDDPRLKARLEALLASERTALDFMKRLSLGGGEDSASSEGEEQGVDAGSGRGREQPGGRMEDETAVVKADQPVGRETELVRETRTDGAKTDRPDTNADLSDFVRDALADIDLHPGGRVGPYRLTEVLGEGGFGVVFRAEQERPLRRTVALKVLKPGMDTREVVARFESERQVLALMNHPSIARVYDAGATEQGRSYFVMEHVPGEPITEYCDRNHLRTRERLVLFLAVCAALQHAHQKAVIHRDLKPSNILVMMQDEHPVPKVIDFGISKALDRRPTEETLLTVQGQVMGTPEYMSPEQAEGDGLGIDTRTDIYSLGVLLYELLTGVLPFESKVLRRAGLSEILRVLREEDPPRPSTRLSRLGDRAAQVAEKQRTQVGALVKQLRGDLDWITMKAMAKDRSDRYASASEFASDIARFLNHEPVLARPPSVVYRLRKFVQKRKLAVSVVLVVGLLAASSGVISYAVSEARLREIVSDASTAAATGDLKTARTKLSVLEEAYPFLPVTREVRVQVENAERKADIERSRDLRSQADALWKKHRDLKTSVRSLEKEWAEERKRLPDAAPVWAREKELALWRRLVSTRDEIEDRFHEAILILNNAVEIAPADSEERRNVRRALEEIYWVRHQEAPVEGGVLLGRRSLARLIESQGLGTYARQLDGGGSVGLVTRPAGAEVYCFRYEEYEARLEPRPFSPSAAPSEAVDARPLLRVEKVWDPERSPFVAGDRWLEAGGEEIRSRGDLARALRTMGTDQQVEVKVERSGQKVDLKWIPFPGREPAPLVHPYFQFGFTFAAYPLDFSSRNLVGTTQAGSPLRVDLPRGSYLFVFRKDGYGETRFPVAMPREGTREEVRLLKKSEIPPGFVYVPSGVVRTGGDDEAEQPLPYGTHRVSGFFMSRLEVTLGEWLEFANDPEVLQRTDGDGMCLPRVPEVERELKRAKRERFRLLYRQQKPLWDKDSKTGQWVFLLSYYKPDWPAPGVSHLAGMEYARWRTKAEADREGRGWKYRLPTGLEWERAARGVDRRTFVWGNYRVWSFCWTRPGIPRGRPGLPSTVGISPFDESVFGVRDLTGSNLEPTRDRIEYRFWAYRGASWNQAEDLYLHAGSRNGILPENAALQSGLRLVAELEP